MALTKLNDDLAIIAKLEDEPNDVGGLTADELKARFDRAGEIIQKYINETLLPELADPAAADALGAMLSGDSMSVQQALDILSTAAQKNGNIPTGGHTGEVLVKQSDEVYDTQWQEMFTTVDFTADQWVQGEDGTFTLTIPQSRHKRMGGKLNCLVRHLVNGVLTENTWAVLGTGSRLDEGTGNVILTGADGFDGSVLFFG